MTMRLATAECPSCKHSFFREDFNHTCDKGPWYSAALCDGCGRVIDGNEVHFCPADDLPMSHARYRELYNALCSLVK